MIYKIIDGISNNIIPKVVEMSIIATVAILLVIIARFFLRKAPKIFSYALWSIVLFRLLCPISFTAPFSIYNIFNNVTSSTEQFQIKDDSDNQTENLINVPSIYKEQSVANDYSENAGHTNIANAEVETFDIAEIESEKNEPEITRKITLSNALSVVWLWGMCIVYLLNIISFSKVKRNISESLQIENNIYISDQIDMPFCLGIIRPRIYLPSKLDEDERGYIIIHEQTHIRRFDHIIKLLAMVALGIHWFNPFVWIAFILVGKDMEMSCDESVLLKMDEDIRADYSASLLSLASGRKINIASTLAFGEGNPKQRINHIMNFRKPKIWVISIAIVVCIIVGICLVTNPIAKADEEQIINQLTTSESNIPIENDEVLPVFIDINQYYITNIGDPTNLYHIDDEEVLWGCGSNNYGQLGQGTQDYEFHEDNVKIAEGVIHVDFSQHGFTIYLTKDHKLYGVGNAGSGALQQYDSFDWDKYINGESYFIAEPVLLMENVAYARCGRDDIVCLTGDGEVWTWGTVAIEGGYLSSDVLFYSEPQKILDGVVFVTGGWFNHAALKSDGSVWTWGYNSAGNCGVENPTVISEPIMVADNVKMVWTGYTQTNSKEQSISEFEGIYPVFINNTIICKSDDTFWICGENVGTEEKVVHGAEGDYTVAFSSEFVPYDSNQYTEEEKDLLIENIKENGMSAEKTQYEQLYSMRATCENLPDISGTWNRTNVYSSESSILEIENVDDNGYDFLIRAQFADHSGYVEGRAYFISEHCAIYRLDEIDVGILPETEYEYVLFVFEDDGVNIYASANSAEMNLGMHVDVAGYYISDVPEYID